MAALPYAGHGSSEVVPSNHSMAQGEVDLGSSLQEVAARSSHTATVVAYASSQVVVHSHSRSIAIEVAAASSTEASAVVAPFHSWASSIALAPSTRAEET